jgi:hypothetical protein
MKKILLLAVLFFAGCATISNFDQTSYLNATSYKVDVLNLMSEATTDYYLHEGEIKSVSDNLKKQYEYEKHREKNQITVNMYLLLTDTSKSLFGGFLKHWREKRVLSQDYIDEKKAQISNGFDAIADLEQKKRKQPSQPQMQQQ